MTAATALPTGMEAIPGGSFAMGSDAPAGAEDGEEVGFEPGVLF